jgi:hypothetical protein
MAHALQLSNLGLKRSLRRDGEYNRRQWSPVRSLQSPTWLKEIYDRISSLAKLEENWDSYRGLPVALGAASTIRVLLSNLDIENMPRPHVAAIPDGGIGLHWRVGKRDLEIEVEPNGKSVHLLRTNVGGQSIADDARTPKDVQDALDWVLGS